MANTSELSFVACLPDCGCCHEPLSFPLTNSLSLHSLCSLYPTESKPSRGSLQCQLELEPRASPTHTYRWDIPHHLPTTLPLPALPTRTNAGNGRRRRFIPYRFSLSPSFVLFPRRASIFFSSASTLFPHFYLTRRILSRTPLYRSRPLSMLRVFFWQWFFSRATYTRSHRPTVYASFSFLLDPFAAFSPFLHTLRTDVRPENWVFHSPRFRKHNDLCCVLPNRNSFNANCRADLLPYCPAFSMPCRRYAIDPFCFVPSPSPFSQPFNLKTTLLFTCASICPNSLPYKCSHGFIATRYRW